MVRHIHNHPHIQSANQNQLTNLSSPGKEQKNARKLELQRLLQRYHNVPWSHRDYYAPDVIWSSSHWNVWNVYTYVYIYTHNNFIYIWNVWNEMRIHANSIVAVHKSLTRSTFHFWRVLRYGPEEFQVFYLSHEMIWAFPFVDLAFSFKLYTTLHNQLQRQLA